MQNRDRLLLENIRKMLSRYGTFNFSATSKFLLIFIIFPARTILQYNQSTLCCPHAIPIEMILQGLVRFHKVPINLLLIVTKGTVHKSMSCRSVSWDNILSDSQVQRINQGYNNTKRI